jgi:hypothetical protein
MTRGPQWKGMAVCRMVLPFHPPSPSPGARLTPRRPGRTRQDGAVRGGGNLVSTALSSGENFVLVRFIWFPGSFGTHRQADAREAGLARAGAAPRLASFAWTEGWGGMGSAFLRPFANSGWRDGLAFLCPFANCVCDTSVASAKLMKKTCLDSDGRSSLTP